MPRGRRKKPVNYDEELAVLDTQINDLTKKLQAVKERKKARIKKEEENKDADKWEQIKNSGYSVDELLVMVNKQKD
jgi:hypothetical protein